MIKIPFITKLYLQLGFLCYFIAIASATDRSAATTFLSRNKNDPDRLFSTYYFTEIVGDYFCDSNNLILTLDENRNLEELQKFWTNTTHSVANVKEDFFTNVTTFNNKYNFHVRRIAFKLLDKRDYDIQFSSQRHTSIYVLQFFDRNSRFKFSFQMNEEQLYQIFYDMKYFSLTEEQLEKVWENLIDLSDWEISFARKCAFAHSNDLFTIPYFKNRLQNNNQQIKSYSNSNGTYLVDDGERICLLDLDSIESSKSVSHIIRVFATHYKQKLPDIVNFLVGQFTSKFNADSLKDIFDNAPADNSTIQLVIKYIADNYFRTATSVIGTFTSSAILGSTVTQQKDHLLLLLKNMKYFVEKSNYNTLHALFSAASHLMDAMQTVDNIENLGIKASNNLLLNRTLEYEAMPRVVPEYLIYSRYRDFRNSSIYLSLSPTAQAAYIKYFPPVFETFPIISSSPTHSSSSNALPSGTSYKYFLKQAIYDNFTPTSMNTGINVICWEIIDVDLDQNIDTDGINQFKKVIDTFINVPILENIKQDVKASNVPSKHLEQLSKVLDARIDTLNNRIEQDVPISNSTSAGVTLDASSSSNRIFIASLMTISLFYEL